MTGKGADRVTGKGADRVTGSMGHVRAGKGKRRGPEPVRFIM